MRVETQFKEANSAQINGKIGNLRAVHLLLGQTKVDGTLLCLCAEPEDVPYIAEKIDT